MPYFLYKLAPPRPTFAQDMSDHEASVMGEHAAYWLDLVRRGRVVVFGPVADPAGTWGLAVVEAPDEAAVRGLGTADPAVATGIATFDVHAMPMTTVRSVSSCGS